MFNQLNCFDWLQNKKPTSGDSFNRGNPILSEINIISLLPQSYVRWNSQLEFLKLEIYMFFFNFVVFRIKTDALHD